MPKKDPDLETLRKRLAKGSLYSFENERNLNIWHCNESAQKFARKLCSGDTVMFLALDRSKNESCGFRVSLIRGEDVGYVLMKRYEVVSCLKYLDPEAFSG
jgi:hypothetical protein